MSTSFPTDPTSIARTDPDLLGSELNNLGQFLDYHRATFAQKCAGLDTEQLKCRATPPSNLSLLGLARHLSEVERGWFAGCLLGRDVEERYCTPDNPDGDFDDLNSATLVEVWDDYQGAIEQSRRILAGFDSADDTSLESARGVRTVRWVLLHLIEEYARHNGHADLLREAIDGSTGE